MFLRVFILVLGLVLSFVNSTVLAELCESDYESLVDKQTIRAADVAGLFDGARSGEPQARSRLSELVFERAVRIIHRWFPDASASAEDIAQDIVVHQLERGFQGYEGTAAFSTWLHGVTRNFVRRHFRSRRTDRERTEKIAQAMLENSNGNGLTIGPGGKRLSSTELGAIMGEELPRLRSVLEDAIASLPESKRRVIELRQAGMNYQEISDALNDGTKASTVKTRVFHAVRSVTEKLVEAYPVELASRESEIREILLAGQFSLFEAPVAVVPQPTKPQTIVKDASNPVPPIAPLSQQMELVPAMQ